MSAPRSAVPPGLAVLAALYVCSPARGGAQPDRPPPSLQLEHAVAFALAHHPSLRVRSAVEVQAASRTTLLRTGYLPQLEAGLQWNRATGNVLAGSLFPMHGTPMVTGPPMPAQFDGGAFGSQATLSAAWDAMGLVQKMAQVDAALLEQRQAQAGTSVRKLEVAYAAADRFLQLAALGATVQAARANVERARTFATLVEARQKSELRPGADLSRARAELALAETQRVRVEQAEAVGRVELAQALGVPGYPVTIATQDLIQALPAEEGRQPTARHPALVEADAAVAAAQAQTRAAQLQYLPRLDLVAALWVRGSGLGDASGAHGLLPDTPNWAAGLVLSWPALEMFGVRARVRLAQAQTDLQSAQREELAQTIASQVDAARATLDAAVRVAQNTPVALAAARATEQQAQARYRAGLADVLAVAEAQRLLAQAESEDAVAHLAILRARLLVARALGDLTPFLAAAAEGR
jgi:outer membrane protein TolC